jgi:hypothetical protein
MTGLMKKILQFQNSDSCDKGRLNRIRVVEQTGFSDPVFFLFSELCVLGRGAGGERQIFGSRNFYSMKNENIMKDQSNFTIFIFFREMSQNWAQNQSKSRFWIDFGLSGVSGSMRK